MHLSIIFCKLFGNTNIFHTGDLSTVHIQIKLVVLVKSSAEKQTKNSVPWKYTNCGEWLHSQHACI